MATDRAATDSTSRDQELQATFHRAVEDGSRRLRRSWPNLFATGFIGGFDLGIGVLALLVVEGATGSRLLGALAFSIGFIALTLGRSELFTENFMVPVTAVVAHRASMGALLRLWAGTAVTNLAGGWLVAFMMMGALPHLHETAVEAASFYPDLGYGWTSFALGMLGGAAITLLTWMEQGSNGEFGKVVAAVAIGFLLAAVPLNHVIVGSVEMFAALQVGAPFGYRTWAATAGWAALANLVGGLLLVTVLRLVQVGGGEISEARRG